MRTFRSRRQRRRSLWLSSLAPIENALADDALRARTWAPGASKPGTLTAPRAFNLMFKTHVGALEDKSSVASLRPGAARLLITGWNEELSGEELERLGIHSVLAKPWDDAVLKQTLREALGLPPAAAPPTRP